MALKASSLKVEETSKRGAKPAVKPLPAGTWKDRFPGRITKEDAEAEPVHKRLFSE